jgi:hypothetical protein
LTETNSGLGGSFSGAIGSAMPSVFGSSMMNTRTLEVLNRQENSRS